MKPETGLDSKPTGLERLDMERIENDLDLKTALESLTYLSRLNAGISLNNTQLVPMVFFEECED